MSRGRLAGLIAFLMMTDPAFALTRKFRIYNLESGVKIAAAFKFKWSSMSGLVEAKMPNGEKLEGEYSGSHDGGLSWGSIYSGGSSASATGVFIGKVRGSMIMTGASGFVIQCEYVTNPTTTHGNGACKDNQGGTYSLLF